MPPRGDETQEGGGLWTYPHSADVLQPAGLRPVAHCIAKRRRNIAKTIQGRGILKECREAERRRGTPSRMMWWDQKLDFVEEGGSRDLGFIMSTRGGAEEGRFGRS